MKRYIGKIILSSSIISFVCTIALIIYKICDSILLNLYYPHTYIILILTFVGSIFLALYRIIDLLEIR